MIRGLFIIAAFLLGNAPVLAAPAPANPPKPLLAQVQRLVDLLRDSHAMGYPDATMVQIVKRRDGDDLAFTVFTVEGFGGGNNYTQYLAAFTPDLDGNGKQHFQLIDVIPVGGRGWRTVEHLKATVSRAKGGETAIAIDALQVAGDDAPNFPSRKMTIHVLLKDGRLVEQKSQ